MSKVNFIFKKIFAVEENKSMLISFLNAVIKDKDEIKEVEIKKDIEDKYSRLEIKAKTNNNKNINIEIQVGNGSDIIERSLGYLSSQIAKGDEYDTITKTVSINILDIKYSRTDRFHTTYVLKEIETNEELTNIEEIHFIEIPKLKDFDKVEEISDMLEAWVTFMKSPRSEIMNELENKYEEIKKAKEELIRLSYKEKEIE